MTHKPPLPDKLARAFADCEQALTEARNKSTRLTQELELWIAKHPGKNAPLGLLSQLDQLETHISTLHETRMLIRTEAHAFYDLQDESENTSR